MFQLSEILISQISCFQKFLDASSYVDVVTQVQTAVILSRARLT